MAVLPNQPLNNAINQNSGILNQIAQSATNSVQGAFGFNPYMSRQNVATMFQYSQNTTGPTAIVGFTPQASQDWRVRITLAPNANYFYADPSNTLLSPLRTEVTNNVAGALVQSAGAVFGTSDGQQRVGVVFPYTPQLQISHTANYTQQKLIHNNYAQYFYENSEVGEITISGEFTVQNVNEGQYLLATIYLFRSLTKMFFGNDATGSAGNPPPIVYLNGYGKYYLPNVPCVVKSFQHTMPPDVDYMDIPEPGLTYNPYIQNPVLNSTRLPTTSTVNVTLQPVYSRKAQSLNFNLNDFARGALINRNPSSATAFNATTKPLNGGASGAGGFL